MSQFTRFFLMVFCLIIFPSVGTAGEIYMWTDEEGVTHIEDQRPDEVNVEGYRENESTPEELLNFQMTQERALSRMHQHYDNQSAERAANIRRAEDAYQAKIRAGIAQDEREESVATRARAVRDILEKSGHGDLYTREVEKGVKDKFTNPKPPNPQQEIEDRVSDLEQDLWREKTMRIINEQ